MIPFQQTSKVCTLSFGNFHRLGGLRYTAVMSDDRHSVVEKHVQKRGIYHVKKIFVIGTFKTRAQSFDRSNIIYVRQRKVVYFRLDDLYSAGSQSSTSCEPAEVGVQHNDLLASFRGLTTLVNAFHWSMYA